MLSLEQRRGKLFSTEDSFGITISGETRLDGTYPAPIYLLMCVLCPLKVLLLFYDCCNHFIWSCYPIFASGSCKLAVQEKFN